MSIEDRMRRAFALLFATVFAVAGLIILLVVAVDAVRERDYETAVGTVVAVGATSVLCYGGLRHFARPEVRR